MNKVGMGIAGVLLLAAGAGGGYVFANSAPVPAGAAAGERPAAPERAVKAKSLTQTLLPADYSLKVNPNPDAVALAGSILDNEGSCRAVRYHGAYNEFLLIDLEAQRAFRWSISGMAVYTGGQNPMVTYGMTRDGLKLVMAPEDPFERDGFDVEIRGLRKTDAGDIWLDGSEGGLSWELDCGPVNSAPRQWRSEIHDAMTREVERRGGVAFRAGPHEPGGRLAGMPLARREGKLQIAGVNQSTDLRESPLAECFESGCRYRGERFAGVPIHQSSITIDSYGRPKVMSLSFSEGSFDTLLEALIAEHGEPDADRTDSDGYRALWWRGYEGHDKFYLVSKRGAVDRIEARFPYNGAD